MVYSVTPTGFGHKGSGGSKSERLLSERPSLPDDLAGLVAQARQAADVPFQPEYRLLRKLADAIEAQAAEAKAEGMREAARIAQAHELECAKWVIGEDGYTVASEQCARIAEAILGAIQSP